MVEQHIMEAMSGTPEGDVRTQPDLAQNDTCQTFSSYMLCIASATFSTHFMRTVQIGTPQRHMGVFLSGPGTPHYSRCSHVTALLLAAHMRVLDCLDCMHAGAQSSVA